MITLIVQVPVAFCHENQGMGRWRNHHANGESTMTTIFQIAKSAIADRRGVTAMEYGLIAGVLAVGLAAAFTALGDRLEAAFAALAF